MATFYFLFCFRNKVLFLSRLLMEHAIKLISNDLWEVKSWHDYWKTIVLISIVLFYSWIKRRASIVFCFEILFIAFQWQLKTYWYTTQAYGTCKINSRRIIVFKMIWGQSYKTFHTLRQIYKLVRKLDNVLWLRKYLVGI